MLMKIENYKELELEKGEQLPDELQEKCKAKANTVESCYNCYFFSPDDHSYGFWLDHDARPFIYASCTGQCRRYPPAIKKYPAYPCVDDYDWCGEWVKRKPEDPS